MKSPLLGSHTNARLARARAAFVSVKTPEEFLRRQAEIEGLPEVTWNGQRLRTLRCHGTTGNGPHDQNVPESLLWSLIDIRDWICAFHQR